MLRRLIGACFAALLGLCMCTPWTAAQEVPPVVSTPVTSPPEKVDAPHLPNAYRITPGVISGGLPDGEAGFRELKGLGIRTVISVDGMTPDVEGARKFGLRYVHLPHGYDRVPLERGKELAKAIRDLKGPVYIHCHHGKHRSPAAAAVGCVEAGVLSADAAETVLKTAGTNPNYRGLFESVRKARPLTKAELDSLIVEFRETTPIPPLAEAMVHLEHSFDAVKKLSAASWEPASQTAPAALLLLEEYREMQRLDDVATQPQRFRDLLAESLKQAEALESALAAKPLQSEAAAKALGALSSGCATCHKDFRDGTH